jgi:hypothetical protein
VKAFLCIDRTSDEVLSIHKINKKAVVNEQKSYLSPLLEINYLEIAMQKHDQNNIFLDILN